MAAFYACYHGPSGLKAIATRISSMAASTATVLSGLGYDIQTKSFFDTFTVKTPKATAIYLQAAKNGTLV